MKLLLDEHYSTEIARQLRDRFGHDVVAVKERPDLVGMTGDSLFDRCLAEDRAILTENVPDFILLHDRCLRSGRKHNGLIFTSPRRFPRSRAGVGVTVRALHEFLANVKDDRLLVNTVVWLEEI